MEDFGCLWDFEEDVDELRQKVLVMAYELESTKQQANEEMKKNRDKLLQLLNLLQTAYKERDEARDQLQGILLNYNATTPDHPHFYHGNNNSTPTPTTAATFTPLSPESPLRLTPTADTTPAPAKTSAAAGTGCNSSTSASNTPSVDSFFDSPAVSSPDLSPSFNAVVVVGSFSANNHNPTTTTNSIHHPPLQASHVPDFSPSLPPLFPTPLIYPDQTTTARTSSPGGASKTDQASTIICPALAKGKPLPQKGRLLQAVIEAGPLLQTVMVAGPLPRWRNPPPAQPLRIPTFGNGGTSYNCPVLGGATTVAAWNSTYLAAAAKGSYHSTNSSGNYAQMSCGGSSQMYQTATTMLNFDVGSSAAAGGPSIGGGTRRRRMTTATSGSTGIHTFINNQISMPKRQRIQ